MDAKGYIHNPENPFEWPDLRLGQPPMLYTPVCCTPVGKVTLRKLLTKWGNGYADAARHSAQTNELKEVQS